MHFIARIATMARHNLSPTMTSITHISLIGFCIYAMLWTPSIVPSADTTKHLFSEQRAMQHVTTLASYERQVSTPGVERAAAYIHEVATSIATLAARTRPDLRVEVLREQHSGAVGFSLFGAELTNVYANITNIAVRVAAVNNTSPAFLINAHFDSTLGSSGASDCASCVGVALEALRAIVEGPLGSAPPAPVVFLLNGGEETFMQGAAGFASEGAWRNDIGAFLNLESTGTHGLPILFQHTSSWAANVYAASAPAPRGTALSQDFFATGIIPADTDYKVLAGPGGIPGIDVAYVLGGAVYHTSRDAVENIRPGTVQEMGNMVMGCINGFTSALAEPDAAGRAAPDGGAYYFDLFWVMVRYSKATVGPWLHGLPLLALALAPLLVARATAQPVLLLCAATAHAMKLALASAVGALLLPLAVGALRALLLGTVQTNAVFIIFTRDLSGNPMVFFAHHWAAYAMYLPCALAGALLPYTQQASADPLVSAMGAAWAWGIVGAVATRAQLGVAIYPFLWTAPLPLLLPLLARLCPPHWRLFGLLIGTAPASVVGISSMLTLVEHLMGRLTMAGAHPGALGVALADAVVAALMGVGAVVAAGPLLPAYGTAAGTIRTRRAVKTLLLTGIVASLLATAALKPFGVDHPKRLYVQHLHTVQPDGAVDAYYVAATTDVHPVRPLMADTRGAWDVREDMLRVCMLGENMFLS